MPPDIFSVFSCLVNIENARSNDLIMKMLNNYGIYGNYFVYSTAFAEKSMLSENAALYIYIYIPI